MTDPEPPAPKETRSSRRAARQAQAGERPTPAQPRQPQQKAAPPPDKPAPQVQRQPQAKPPPGAKPEEPRPPPASILDSLFAHIPVVHRLSSSELLQGMKKESDRALIHPKLLKFALRSSQNLLLDEDEKTRRFLRMMSAQIRDEPVGEEKFSRSIQALISRTMDFLYSAKKRVTPIGIGQAVRILKKRNSEPEPAHRETAAIAEIQRERLLDGIKHFIEEKVDDVVEFLKRMVSETIVDDDVILTYGWSPVICEALKSAHKRGIRFRLIVVDSRPNFDARRLVECVPELDVRYVLITGVSYVMPEVKKVLIEPCGILSNNAAQTPIGTAMISMMAHESGVPVIFVCPSYRFVSKVSIDALSKNERLTPEFLRPVPRPDVTAEPRYLALTYDVTPGQYVDIVMCELGNIPVNSISTNIKFIQDSYTLFAGAADRKPSPKARK